MISHLYDFSTDFRQFELYMNVTGLDVGRVLPGCKAD